jgi:hypothetical protein
LQVVKIPRPMRMVWGGLAAYWLSGIIHPAFVAIAVMIVLFIPILINEYFKPELVLEPPKPDPHHHRPQIVAPAPKKADASSTRLLLEENSKPEGRSE